MMMLAKVLKLGKGLMVLGDFARAAPTAVTIAPKKWRTEEKAVRIQDPTLLLWSTHCLPLGHLLPRDENIFQHK